MSAITDLNRPDVRWQPRVYPAWNMETFQSLQRRKDELFDALRAVVNEYRAEKPGVYKDYLREVAANALIQWMDAYDAYRIYLREGDA